MKCAGKAFLATGLKMAGANSRASVEIISGPDNRCVPMIQVIQTELVRANGEESRNSGNIYDKMTGLDG
jgi:hypothetical protein